MKSLNVTNHMKSIEISLSTIMSFCSFFHVPESKISFFFVLTAGVSPLRDLLDFPS